MELDSVRRTGMGWTEVKLGGNVIIATTIEANIRWGWGMIENCGYRLSQAPEIDWQSVL